jgi:hypothetical protein
MRKIDRTFLGTYEFPPEELLFGIARMFSYPGGGAAYRVSAASPQAWEEISFGTTEALVVVEDPALVLFVDLTRITAYGREGLAWQSEQLVWDDLRAGDRREHVARRRVRRSGKSDRTVRCRPRDREIGRRAASRSAVAVRIPRTVDTGQRNRTLPLMAGHDVKRKWPTW